MSLPHALLTALVERASSGIELSSRFDRSLGYFWQASHQQIYRELARLEEAGWVESLPPENGRGRKRVYRVLPAGRQELQRWAGQADEPVPSRNSLMVKMSAEAALGDTGIEREVARLLAVHQARLDVYRDIERRYFPGAASPPATRPPGATGAARTAPISRATAIHHLVLKAGIMTETLWVDWATEALGVLGQPASGLPATCTGEAG